MKRGNPFEMHNFTIYLIILSLIAFSKTTASLNVPLGKIGAILSETSRPGKEAKVSIEIAIQDFNIKAGRSSSVLYLKNSLNKPFHAAFAAKELIDEHGVKVILGGHTWEEASAIAEVINKTHHQDIPIHTDHEHDVKAILGGHTWEEEASSIAEVINESRPLFLSLASTTPLQTTNKWPFVVQVVLSQSTPMNALAAMLKSWGIRQVTFIYETSNLVSSSSSSVISHLNQAFHETRCEVTRDIPLTSDSCDLHKELEVLKREKRKVFIIHTSLELGIRLFQTAKKMEMTGNGYLWIATNEITDLFHSINPTIISSLKGMVGVKSYLPANTPEFQDFRKRFRQKFRSDYPEDEQDEPGIFAVQAYTAMKLLEKGAPENLHNWRLVPATSMEIVSVIGKGYHSVYWTQGFGFSETIFDINGEKTIYTHSIDDVVQSLWPRQPWYVLRQHHWDLVESLKKWIMVRIGAYLSLFLRFGEDGDDSEGGLVGSVFNLIMRTMNLPFKYCCFCCVQSLIGVKSLFYGREESDTKNKKEKHSEF